MGRRGPQARPVEDRFFEKVDVRGPDDCWDWQAGLSKGYGLFHVGRVEGRIKTMQAHRFSYELHCGEIGSSEWCVCHACDRPICVNPEHLFLAKHETNMADAAQKGRMPKGEGQWKAKLTESTVREIRQLHVEGIAQKTIANRYGVLQSNVSAIVLRKTWRHVA